MTKHLLLIFTVMLSILGLSACSDERMEEQREELRPREGGALEPDGREPTMP